MHDIYKYLRNYKVYLTLIDIQNYKKVKRYKKVEYLKVFKKMTRLKWYLNSIERKYKTTKMQT